MRRQFKMSYFTIILPRKEGGFTILMNGNMECFVNTNFLKSKVVKKLFSKSFLDTHPGNFSLFLNIPNAVVNDTSWRHDTQHSDTLHNSI